MTVLENERSYLRREAVVFHKTKERWGELSNMASGFPLVVVGSVWPSSGDSSIVERSMKDRYWGAIESEDGTLEGENVLGRLLMELREELRTRSRDELSIVAPPRVDQLLLLGRPVGVVRYDDVADRGAVRV